MQKQNKIQLNFFTSKVEIHNKWLNDLLFYMILHGFLYRFLYLKKSYIEHREEIKGSIIP